MATAIAAGSVTIKINGKEFPVRNLSYQEATRLAQSLGKTSGRWVAEGVLIMGQRKSEKIITGREPMRVVTTGISVRAGVGGRRGRKRRRAEERARRRPIFFTMLETRFVVDESVQGTWMALAHPFLFKQYAVRDETMLRR